MQCTCSVPKEEMGRWCSPLGKARSARRSSNALIDLLRVFFFGWGGCTVNVII